MMHPGEVCPSTGKLKEQQGKEGKIEVRKEHPR
jgi:hypothetical protein